MCVCVQTQLGNALWLRTAGPQGQLLMKVHASINRKKLDYQPWFLAPLSCPWRHILCFSPGKVSNFGYKPRAKRHVFQHHNTQEPRARFCLSWPLMKFRWSVVTSIKGSPLPTRILLLLPFLVSEKHIPTRRAAPDYPLITRGWASLWHSWSCSGYTAPTCGNPSHVGGNEATQRLGNIKPPMVHRRGAGGERCSQQRAELKGRQCVSGKEGAFSEETWERKGKKYHLERTRGARPFWECSPARKAGTSTHLLTMRPLRDPQEGRTAV